MALRVWILMGAVFVLLAACASISEEGCRAGAWDSVGFNDGEAGRSPSHFLNHAKACNEFGIAPNKTVWEVGYAEGLKRYCTPYRAFREGQDGDRLNNVCPAEGLRELQIANDRGLRWYRLGRDIADNEHRIRAINDALSDLPDGDPSRTQLVSERSVLRLENLRLRSRQASIRF